MKLIKKFMADEFGAVTTDWVVLTAAIVSLSLLVMFNVGAGATNVSQHVSDNLDATTVGSP